MRRLFTALALAATLTVSGCAAAMIGGAAIGTAATVTKYAVKGTIGAGKLAYRGTKAVVKGTANLLSDDDAPKRAPSIADDYNNLPDPE